MEPVTATPTEQAADLAALQAAAANEPQAGAAPEQEPQPTIAEELAGMITVFVATLSPALPSLKEIYTKETTAAAGAAIGAVCEKYGWLSTGLFGKYGEELACLAVVGPLAVATYKGVNADIEKAKAKAEEKEKPKQLTNQSAPMPGPESKTVTFGNAPVSA